MPCSSRHLAFFGPKGRNPGRAFRCTMEERRVDGVNLCIHLHLAPFLHACVRACVRACACIEEKLEFQRTFLWEGVHRRKYKKGADRVASSWGSIENLRGGDANGWGFPLQVSFCEWGPLNVGPRGLLTYYERSRHPSQKTCNRRFRLRDSFATRLH